MVVARESESEKASTSPRGVGCLRDAVKNGAQTRVSDHDRNMVGTWSRYMGYMDHVREGGEELPGSRARLNHANSRLAP